MSWIWSFNGSALASWRNRSREIIEDKPVNRRDFLGIVTWAIGGLISLGLAIPAVAYVLGPALQGNKSQNWITLSSTSKVEIGTPTLFNAKGERNTGWITSEEENAAFVLTGKGGDFVALS